MAVTQTNTKAKTTKKPAKKPSASRAAKTATRTRIATVKKTATRRTTRVKKPVVQVKPPQRPSKKAARTLSKEALLNSQPKVVTGFIDFLREQSVVGLAIGLVMGTQVKVLADQLIASFVNPLIGLVLPGRGSLDQKTFSIIVDGKTAVFAWGTFAATLLSFVITAAVIYFVFKSLSLDKLTKKKKEEE